jgi:hypothetical protein
LDFSLTSHKVRTLSLWLIPCSYHGSEPTLSFSESVLPVVIYHQEQGSNNFLTTTHHGLLNTEQW